MKECEVNKSDSYIPPCVFSSLCFCSQITATAFTYISAGCSLLREVVIDDVPTLSNRCVLVSLHGSEVRSEAMLRVVRKVHTLCPSPPQALVGGCRFLTSVSLLGAPHLSNAALMAIAKKTNLSTFGLEGEGFPQRAALTSNLRREGEPLPSTLTHREQPADGC